MKNSKKQIAAIGFAGLLTAMAPIFAQGTGTGTGTTGTGSSGSGSMGSGSTGSGSTSGTRSGSGRSGSSSRSGGTGMSSGSGSSLDHADKKFLTEAAVSGLKEVQLGQLAASKATDPDVKAFGQKMVDDHTSANDKLKQIAASKGVDLPTDLGTMDKHAMDKLQKANGAEFDRLFMSDMVKDHKKVVNDFQHASKSAKDSDVKQFAADTLPTLQDHLRMAQTTAGKFGGSSRSASKSGS